MTDDLILARTIQAQPVELEQRLSGAMREIGREITKRPDIARAVVAADVLKDGYVIGSETQASEVADLVAQIIDGEKVLADRTKAATWIPRQMESALKEAVEPVRALLAKARDTGNRARVAWQQAVRAQAARDEEKARLAAQESARRAAEKAAETGEDAPPVAEVAPVEVPRTVAGGTGKMGTQVRIEVSEVVNWAEVPHRWLTLNTAAARAEFIHSVKKPAPGESVVYCGVTFTSVESAVNRR